MQKITGPKSGPLNRAAISSHQHRPQHGIAQHHPHTSTVRSTVSCSTILTPAPSAAGYRTATSHQHRPQQGIPQRHPHPAASAAGYRAATSIWIWMQKIRGPKSGPLNHAAITSSASAAGYRTATPHQHHPRRGIEQQHPHPAASAAGYRAATSI